jgi:hypothetical protein
MFTPVTWLCVAGTMLLAICSLGVRALKKGSDSNVILKQTNTATFPVFQYIRDNHFSYPV